MSSPVCGKCWNCGAELTANDLGRETLCLGCGKPTRACRNCRWFDPSRAQQCQEPMAEAVTDKQKANYCEFFEPTLEPRGAPAGHQVDARQAADDLFK